MFQDVSFHIAPENIKLPIYKNLDSIAFAHQIIMITHYNIYNQY